jgi:hypothetical protein
MKTKIVRSWKVMPLILLVLETGMLGAQNYTINTIAGNGTQGFSGDGGSASNAKLNSPSGVAFDNHGHILIVDHQNARIRKVDKNTGVITTIAGNGVAGFSGDGGPATAAQLNNPTGVHVVSNGHILIVDHANARIRKVDGNTGIITTIAGNGVHGFSGDGGPATQASLKFPKGVCTNSVGDIFIADEGNSRVRMIDHANGKISTFAGNGLFGFLGDGGLALLAMLNSPSHVAVDNNDHVLIVDHANARIRKVNKNTGIITTIVGNGILGFGGDGGLATLASLKSPSHIFVHSNNHIHIVDQMNMRIRKVDANTGIITTIVGNGIAGFSGDGGDALLAQLNAPACLAINTNDVIIIADQLNHRIRQCVPNTCASPAISVHPINASVCVGSNASFSVAALGTGLSYQWQVDQGGGFVDLVNVGVHSGVTASTLVITGATADLNSSRYRVKVTNSCGMVISNSATLTVKAKPTIQLSVGGVACSETTICEGSSATIVASGASSYMWSNGAITSSITVSPTSQTTYSVTGTDINGCSNTASIIVKVNTKPTVTVSASPASICSGSTSILTASGAASYVWSTGATTASISVSPIATTTYNVVGTGSNGCTTSASVTVTVKTPPTVTVSASPPIVCPGGSSTLTANGATSYVWSTGQTGNSIAVSPSATTTYTVTGTKNGCSTTASVTVTVSPSINVAVVASPSVVCAGSSAVLTATGATSYSWSTGQTGASITVNPAVTTTYTVTGTLNGCSGTASVTVFVNPLPTVSVSASVNSVCPGGSTILTATGANSYVWSTGQTGASIEVSPSATTTYSVTGLGSNGCSATAFVTVSISAALSISVSASPSSICQGESTTLTATGATNYTWSTGQTGASIVVSPNANTTYTVIGTNSSGCSASASVSVTVKTKPIVTAGASPSVICPGGSATLTASGAGSYVWSTGQTTASISVSPGVTTTYSVTGTTNGCSTTTSVTVFVSGSISLSVSASPSVICQGDAATLTASGADSYSWSTGQTGASIVVSPGSSTTYTVTGTTASGCSTSASVSVTVKAKPMIIVSASPSIVCPGGSATLTASGASSYVWSTGQTTASISVSPSVTTTYTATGTSNGCSTTASVTVFVGGSISLSASASPSTICQGESTILTAIGADSYTWNTGQTGASIVVSPSASTTYTVTGSTAGGCSATASVSVTVKAKPVVSVSASPSVICSGASATLTASGASTYVWSTGQTSASISVSPTVTTTYSVTGATNGCSTTTSVTVFVSGSISLSVAASSSSICQGESTTLTAVGADNYVWNTGQTGASIVVSPSVSTTYTVTGTVLSGCSATASVSVNVKAKPVVTVSASSTTVCPGSSTTLTANGASAYIWSTGKTGGSIMVSPSVTTTYSVTGTTNGCSTTSAITIFVNGSINVTASASPSVICPGGLATLTASGASNYVWSTGQTGASIVVSPSATTTYTVTGFLNGCSATASVTVFVSGAVNVAVFASPSSICVGGSSTLTASGASTYLWSTGQTSASIVVDPSVTTTYTVTGFINGCSASASVTVSVGSSIAVAATASPATICAGSSSTLVASGADSYIWSTGQSGASIVVNPGSTTTYTVTGFRNGCSGTASVTVFVNPKPPVTCTASPSIITLGLTSTLTASGALTYRWSTGALGSSILVIPLLTTTYSVVGTDANGCSNTASATVTVNLLGGLGLRTAGDPSETEQQNETATVSAYPNPTSGSFFLKDAPENSTIEVYDYQGARLLIGTVNESDQAIDMSELKAGIYFVRVQAQGKTIYQTRMIKQ